MSKKYTVLVWIFSAVVALLASSVAVAQNTSPSASQNLPQSWPVKPVKIIVPFPAGGSTDVIARLVSQRLSDALKVAVVVDNKPGVGSILGTDFVAKSAPDGYTLILASNPAIAPGPLMRSSMPFDPIKDFSHIALLGTFSNGFVVRADHPAKTMAAFVALARAKPGVLNYASAGVGSSGFLTGELLKQIANINMVHVPYKGSAPAITDLIGGQTDGMFESLVTASGYVRAGKMRLLAITADKRNKLFPDVPTMNEVVPGVTGGAWFGISAPARTPPDVVLRLQSELQAIVNSPDIQARFSELGMTPLALGGADYMVFLANENRKWGPVIKASNIKVD